MRTRILLRPASPWSAAVTLRRMSLAVLLSTLPGPAAGQRTQPVPLGRRSVGVEVSKLFVGENFRFLTSTEDLALGVPVSSSVLLVVRQGLTYATAGTRTSSTRLSNLTVGLATGGAATRVELDLTAPVTRSFGGADYAGDLAILTGLDQRERYVHRWTVAATAGAHTDLEDRSQVGVEAGGLLLSAAGEDPRQLVGRYALYLVVPLRGGASADVRFHGTARLSGAFPSFADRLQDGATLSLWLPRLRILRGLFLYMPLDESTRSYVDAVLGVRLRT
jgi:hypothetical protein